MSPSVYLIKARAQLTMDLFASKGFQVMIDQSVTISGIDTVLWDKLGTNKYLH